MDEEHGAAIEQRPRLWFSFWHRAVVGHGERGLPVTSHVPRAAWRRAISHLRVSRPAVSSRRVCTYMLACQRSAGMSLEYEAIGQYKAIGHWTELAGIRNKTREFFWVSTARAACVLCCEKFLLNISTPQNTPPNTRGEKLGLGDNANKEPKRERRGSSLRSVHALAGVPIRCPGGVAITQISVLWAAV